jgi:ribosomal protein S18 acetylase RimI-like enzyme
MTEFAAMAVHIRPARVEECSRLTDIAHAAKRHWGYPEEWMALWRDDLTYTPARFDTEQILVAEIDQEVAGFAALRCDGDDAELEGLWVDPARMGRGAGRALLAAAVDAAIAAGAAVMIIVADPNAVGFYEEAGACCIGWTASRPAGRRLPRMSLSLGERSDRARRRDVPPG